MYHYLFSLSILKSFTPYFRKHLLTTLNSHELLFINTFFYFFIVLVFFLYKLFFDKTNFIEKTFKNYTNLSFSQFGCLALMALLAVASSIFIFEFDKNYNTPLINSMFIKIASTISLIFIGILLFEEKYHWKQILGFILAIIGIYLISQK